MTGYTKADWWGTTTLDRSLTRLSCRATEEMWFDMMMSYRDIGMTNTSSLPNNDCLYGQEDFLAASPSSPSSSTLSPPATPALSSSTAWRPTVTQSLLAFRGFSGLFSVR